MRQSVLFSQNGSPFNPCRVFDKTKKEREYIINFPLYQGVESVKNSIENAISKTKTLSESLLGGFFKGFMTIFSLIKKK